MSQINKVAQTDKKQFSPNEMMANAEGFALSKTSKTFRQTFGLSVMAGVFIGLAFVFYVTVTTGSSTLGWGLSHLIGGLAFSIGLVFIVVCGGELFTSTVLSLISLANKKITFWKMLKTWSLVYAGNFVGAALLVLLVTAAKLYNIDGGQWGLNALNIAQHKLHHSPVQAFSLGILCNLLVCLAMWMTLSTQDIATKVMLVVMPVALFVSTGFEHCVANMFMIPFGIMTQQFAPASFWVEVGVSASQYSDLTWGNFINHNLLYVTLGNIVGGGIMVGLGYRTIFKTRSFSTIENQINTINPVRKLHTIIATKELNMTLSSNLINNVMDTAPVSLQEQTTIGEAVRVLNHADLESAPVVDSQNNLVGFFSTQDLLVELWCQDYTALDSKTVSSVMRTDVETVNPSDSILHLAEYMAIDHEKLFPVSSSGFATSLTTLTTVERARQMRVNRPSQYPVVKDNKLVGMVTRRHVVEAFGALLTKAAVQTSTLHKKTA